MRLIINADDFGLCESVNEAIIECYLKGNLTSATLMVNMSGTHHAVQLAKKHPELGIGLHFSLTEGKPLTQCDTLTDEKGCFIDRGKLLKRIFLGSINFDELTSEFEAQLNLALSFGIKITHVDSHQHVHLIPKIFHHLLPIIKRQQLSLRNSITHVNRKLLFEKPTKFIKQIIVQRSIIKLKKSYTRSADFMLSIHDFPELLNLKKDLYLRAITEFLEHRKGETMELIVHPYKDTEELEEIYPSDYNMRIPFFQKSFKEYQILSADRLAWEANGFKLINYSSLKE